LSRTKGSEALWQPIKKPRRTSQHLRLILFSMGAIYCGVRCAAIESAVRDGKLRGRRLGRNVVILKADLDAFLAALDIIPAHTPPSILARKAARAVKTKQQKAA
jgi:hypothetical protein